MGESHTEPVEEVTESSRIREKPEKNTNAVQEKATKNVTEKILPQIVSQEVQLEDDPVVEEIDDVEPQLEDNQSKDNHKKEDIDPKSLLASGVSITVIDKKKKDMAAK